MESVSLYSEARTEYLKQLSTWIIPPLVDFYRKEYNTIAARDSKKAMSAFQEFCSTVPLWNQDVIDTHIGALLDTCRCDYVEELMTAVFIAHTKMLTSIRVNSRQKKLQIKLPKLDHFLHRVFVECARAFWKAPFLFAEDLTPVEKQKNVLQAEVMCTEALSGAVRSLLPVKSILQDYLDDGNSDDDVADKAAHAAAAESDEDSDDSEPIVAPIVIPVAAPVPVPEPIVAPVPVPEPVAAPVPVPEPIVAPVPVPEPIVAPVPVPEPIVAPVPAPEPIVAPAVAPVAASAITIEKLDTAPGPIYLTSSNHSIDAASGRLPVVNLEKDINPTPPKLVIETEPTVHFTPYDTVYDENTTSVSEIRYAPKISVEDKPASSWGFDDDAPKLTIGATSSTIEGDDIVDLEPPVHSSRPTTPIDIDVSLGSTLDFEELA
jgi:hypothetical protein